MLFTIDLIKVLDYPALDTWPQNQKRPKVLPVHFRVPHNHFATSLTVRVPGTSGVRRETIHEYHPAIGPNCLHGWHC